MHSKKRTRNSRKNKRSLRSLRNTRNTRTQRNKINKQRGSGDPIFSARIFSLEGNNFKSVGECTNTKIEKNEAFYSDLLYNDTLFHTELLKYIQQSLLQNNGIMENLNNLGVEELTVDKINVIHSIKQGDISGLIFGTVLTDPNPNIIRIIMLRVDADGVKQLCYVCVLDDKIKLKIGEIDKIVAQNSHIFPVIVETLKRLKADKDRYNNFEEKHLAGASIPVLRLFL